jgi:hypothetical protein
MDDFILDYETGEVCYFSTLYINLIIIENIQPSFVPSLRWLLESIGTDGSMEQLLLKTNRIPPNLINQLASCVPYQILADRLGFDHSDNASNTNDDSTTADASRTSNDFLWNLMQSGCWNSGDCSTSLHEAIKDMLTDTEPFYEVRN